MTRLPDFDADTLAALERYVVDGAAALAEPGVAAAVEAHPSFATSLQRVCAEWPQVGPAVTERSWHTAWQRVRKQTTPPYTPQAMVGDVERQVKGGMGADKRGGGKTWRLGNSMLPRMPFSQWALLPSSYMRWVGAMAITLGIVMGGQRLWTGLEGSSASLSNITTYTTRSLQVAHVTLADGTRLTVAPNSTIQVAKDFSAHRRITVIGEVYCDVTEANGVPFVVRAGNITVRVLGTRFDVRHYPPDHAVRITVVSGKIAIASTVLHQSARTLAAGSTATATDSTIQTSEGDVESLTSWTKGELTFHGTPVRDVLATVGYWYGYEFRVTDSTLARHPLSVRFQGDPAEVVLRSLSLILNATLTYHGNVITVTPRRATQSLPMQHLQDTLLHSSMEAGR